MQISNSFPDFSPNSYQVVQELGRSYTGDRITYRAFDTQTNQPVVIKQFCLGAQGASWSGFAAYKREIEVLRSLEHPGIPRYINCFETSQGFCLVQEYKNAQSLARIRSFSLKEIKQIALSLLEILVYLQKRVPPVFHRDIKPENILVDEQIQVTLVDFGFAKIGSQNLSISSVALGTTAFMPPEQLLQQELSLASDLYSLGATLICLVSGIKSVELPKYVDETFAINTKQLLPKSIEPSFQQWLEKLVTPRINKRYSSALEALEAFPATSNKELLTSSLGNERDDKTNERAWQEAKSVEKLLNLLENTDRLERPEIQSGLRLFACWCANQTKSSLIDPYSLRAIDTARNFAEGMATLSELQAAGKALAAVKDNANLCLSTWQKLLLGRKLKPNDFLFLREAALACTHEHSLEAARVAARWARKVNWVPGRQVKQLCRLLGNPFEIC